MLETQCQLSPQEQSQLRELLIASEREVVEQFPVSRSSLARAALGLPVRRGTAALIRAGLGGAAASQTRAIP